MSKKLRESLKKIEEAVNRAFSILNDIPENCNYTGLVEDAADVLCEVKETYIPEALAKPLRNCDVGSAKEQTLRFEKFCLDHNTINVCCTACPVYKGKGKCELVWAQLPYEPTKANKA